MFFLCSFSIIDSIVCDDIKIFNPFVTSGIADAANAAIPTDTYIRLAFPDRIRIVLPPRRLVNVPTVVKRNTKQAKQAYCWKSCSAVTKDTSIPKIW